MKQKSTDNLHFHIKSDDYFVTLATILYFLADEMQRVAKADSSDPSKLIQAQSTACKILLESKEDLMYLQENFMIKERSK